MRICPECGHENNEGTLLCEKCYANLAGETTEVDTRPFAIAPGDAPIRESVGTAAFLPSSQLRIKIQGMETIVVRPDPEITLGRHDRVTGITPDIDLTPLAGYRLGVSRSHATIRLEGESLHLVDLGSSNGTFLNGKRLVPKQPYILHDGDEICLGQMTMRIFFG